MQHFNNGCSKEFSVQILEKLKCSGKKLTKKELGLEAIEREKSETEWMLRLRTVYPYGLN